LLFFDFRFEGRRCRELTLLKDTPVNRKRLEKALAKIEADIAAGTFDYEAAFPGSKRSGSAPAGTTTSVAGSTGPAQSSADSVGAGTPLFKDACEQWMRERKVEWRRSHLQIQQATIDKHLLPAFGEKRVGAITKSDVLAFRASLAELDGHAGAKLSNRRINGILTPLRQILEDAADRHGFNNPLTNLKPLKIRKSDVEPFSLDQVQQILTTVRADYRSYFETRFFTGMRTGEAHGLKWKYVDFKNRLIYIRETFVLGEDEYTKTDASQRDIQMNQVVFDALERQHKVTGQKSEYVFCNRAGQPLYNKNFVDRIWKPLLCHLGLKLRRPYQMRHTAATLWLASGEAPEWIARQLGHSSTEMLFRVYSRYVPNLTRQDGSAIDRLLATRFATGETAMASPPAADRAARPAANEPRGPDAQAPPARMRLRA
jgi:integrase